MKHEAQCTNHSGAHRTHIKLAITGAEVQEVAQAVVLAQVLKNGDFLMQLLAQMRRCCAQNFDGACCAVKTFAPLVCARVHHVP